MDRGVLCRRWQVAQLEEQGRLVEASVSALQPSPPSLLHTGTLTPLLVRVQALMASQLAPQQPSQPSPQWPTQPAPSSHPPLPPPPSANLAWSESSGARGAPKVSAEIDKSELTELAL